MKAYVKNIKRGCGGCGCCGSPMLENLDGLQIDDVRYNKEKNKVVIRGNGCEYTIDEYFAKKASEK